MPTVKNRCILEIHGKFLPSRTERTPVAGDCMGKVTLPDLSPIRFKAESHLTELRQIRRATRGDGARHLFLALSFLPFVLLADDWQLLNDDWQFSPSSVREEQHLMYKDPKLKSYAFWVRSANGKIAFKISAHCPGKQYWITHVLTEREGGNPKREVSEVDFPPGHVLYYLKSGIDSYCKTKQPWWRVW